jgi:hypothetical protein
MTLHRPHPESVTLSNQQWSKARQMWRNGSDTFDVASYFGCTEAYVYRFIHILKMKG